MKGASGGYSASTIDSAGGNLTIDAGRDVGIMASNLLAQDGNISIVGSNVAIIAGVGEARQHEYHEFKQSGLTIGVAGGVLGAAQQIQGTLQQAGDAKSGRLAAVKVGQAAYQAVQANRMMDAAKADNASVAQKEAASAQIQISLGSSKSVSETKRTQETAFGSSVMASGNISISALGEKGVAGSANLSIIGSDLAGKNVLLAATNDLMLQSQAQTSTEVSTNKNSGWKVGVGIGVSDSGSGGGINIFASGYVGSGNARGNGTTYRETQVSARDNLTLISGRDTVLEGAQARADSIRADIGRNLILASQQDSDRYDAKQKQANAGASFSFGSMTGNAYLGASIGKTKSNYDSVVEQTGLFAGSGGYDIYVGKHTQLDGAVIASDAEATKNRLSTDTLGFSNLHNKADYKSTTVGINLGMSGAFDKPNKGDALGGGPSGLSFGSTSGSESGTTRAAVSAGTIEVRSDKDTGRDSTAGLSRDTVGANGSIGKIFDKDKVREQLEFQQPFGQLGMQIAGDALKGLAKDNPDFWGEGRAGAIALHAAVAGVGAALGGGNVAGAVAGTVSGDVVGDLVRDQIAQAVVGLPTEIRDQVTKVVTNIVVSAAGAGVGGLSGAGGAAVADMFNRQLHPSEYDFAKKNAKVVADHLKITEEEAISRIVAEILRNSDRDAAESSGGKHDWEIRAAVGCNNLNCSGIKLDVEYANSQFNAQYVEMYKNEYMQGLWYLQTGLTDAELREKNMGYERIGKGALTLAGCAVLGPQACQRCWRGGGGGLSAGLSFFTNSPFTTADMLSSAYGGLLGATYRAQLTGWSMASGGVPQKYISNGFDSIENMVIRFSSLAPVFAGKQISVPIGEEAGLGRAVDPFFDPARNPWWGIDNFKRNISGR